MPFTNTQIEINSLPSISDIDYKNLDKDYLKASMIGTSFAWIVISVIVGFVIQMNRSNNEFQEEVGPYIVYFVTALTFLAMLSLLLTYLGFSKKGYAVRDKDISYKKGLLWKSKTLIPFNRIQHSEVKQGPFERMFGLASLRVFTAGGSASDLSINGLKQEEADRLKQFIIMKTSADEEE